VNHPFLTFVEVALVRWLSRSPRIGLILIKQHGTNISWVIKDRSDPNPLQMQEITHEQQATEPVSMSFERMFHAPDAER
jgi:hypothetical protein